MRIIGDELIFGKLFKDIGCQDINLKKLKIMKYLKL